MSEIPPPQPSPAKGGGRIFYVIAGEPSGDLLGAHLMRSLKAQSKEPITFYGVGGERMIAEGLTSLFPYYELAMLGFLEVLPFFFNIMARINLVVEDITAKNPDVLITIDSPGFCSRVVRRLRKESFKTKFVHYVAPTVWAYKPERAANCATLFDHLLALLPFEPPYFEKVGLKTTFVGHPVVGETKIGDGAAFRKKYEIAPETKLFCLLPGSRKGEVERHMPIFAQAVSMLATQYPDIAIAVAVPTHVMNFVAPFFKTCPFRAIVMSNEEDKKGAIAGSDIAIVKSGTVALEVAMSGTPMIVAYRVNPLSAWAFKRIRLTRFVNLINILLGREVIPELLQELCTPLMIARAASQLLENPEAQKQQKNDVAAALKMLLPADGKLPSDVAAETILGLL